MSSQGSKLKSQKRIKEEDIAELAWELAQYAQRKLKSRRTPRKDKPKWARILAAALRILVLLKKEGILEPEMDDISQLLAKIPRKYRPPEWMFSL